MTRYQWEIKIQTLDNIFHTTFYEQPVRHDYDEGDEIYITTEKGHYLSILKHNVVYVEIEKKELTEATSMGVEA